MALRGAGMKWMVLMVKSDVGRVGDGFYHTLFSPLLVIITFICLILITYTCGCKVRV